MNAMNSVELIKVMIVDDHFVVRSGLVASLEMEDDLKVVAEAKRGEDAVALFAQHQPSVVLMDLQLPGIGGVEATSLLVERDPEARVLIFSTFARVDEVRAALEAGALGYVQKSASREDLLAAVRNVAAGRRHLPAELTPRLAEIRARTAITVREREILALISQGRANKEIAAAFEISEDTVKRHVSHILLKLEVPDRAAATAEAIRRGILKAPE